ncbi:hypothetical protein JOF47_001474 [Paeniglutamicibacter kerguelensis]|uniref:Uncharacterized protein n=1 Tax=Paeniglutamicibacter kerguelensis TaxID=254788 RepID=A0ABS4XBW1_9MICC|nr:hypothetical protein [Paeniglutamicibacter kerguelensis]
MVIAERRYIEIEKSRGADAVHFDLADSLQVSGEYRLQNCSLGAEGFQRFKRPRQGTTTVFRKYVASLLGQGSCEVLQLPWQFSCPGAPCLMKSPSIARSVRPANGMLSGASVEKSCLNADSMAARPKHAG